MKKLFFRCDASSQVGLGHLKRCLALAQQLCSIEIFFIHISDPQDFVLKLLSSQEVIWLPEVNTKDEEVEFVRSVIDSKDFLIVDHYGWSPEMIQNLSTTHCHIGMINDFATQEFPVEFLLDYTLGRKISVYHSWKKIPPYLYVGHEFAIVDSSFFEGRKRLYQSRLMTVDKPIFYLQFGGVDSRGMGLEFLKSFLSLSWNFELNFAYTSLNKYLDSIESMKILLKNDSRFKFHQDGLDQKILMTGSTMGVGAGGVSVYERIACLLPSALVWVNDSQKENATNYAAMKLGINLGCWNDVQSNVGMMDNAQRLIQQNYLEYIEFNYRLWEEDTIPTQKAVEGVLSWMHDTPKL